MSADGQGTKWCRNIAENFSRLSRANEHYSQTTDKQTDGRRHIANTFAKNVPIAKQTISGCMLQVRATTPYLECLEGPFRAAKYSLLSTRSRAAASSAAFMKTCRRSDQLYLLLGYFLFVRLLSQSFYLLIQNMTDGTILLNSAFWYVWQFWVRAGCHTMHEYSKHN